VVAATPFAFLPLPASLLLLPPAAGRQIHKGTNAFKIQYCQMPIMYKPLIDTA